MNTDSDNNGVVEMAKDDPANAPTFEMTAPGKIIEKDGLAAERHWPLR